MGKGSKKVTKATLGKPMLIIPEKKKCLSVVVDNFKSHDGFWVKCRTVGRTQYRTRSYETWKTIVARCRSGSSYQKASPNYLGCSMHDDFKDFQRFVEWHMSQPAFGMTGYAVDKDILGRGGDQYSQSACALVPHALNNFYTRSGKGKFPRGVKAGKSKTKVTFIAEIRIENKTTYIGSYQTAVEASNAYCVAKKDEATRWAKRLSAGEFLVIPAVVKALEEWEPYV